MDPIKYVFEKPAVTGRMARWQMLLTEYDITYVTRKAVKGSIIAEYLADRAVNDYQSMEFDFPDQDIDSIDQEKEGNVGWMMLFDGATNVWGHGIGAVLISPEGKYYPVTAKLTFPCTNNIAEYEACVLGLQAAIDRGIKKLIVKGDSALVIYQLTGKWETRDSKLIPYQEFIQEMMQEFDAISFSHLPRESNLIPDALATLAALFKVESGIEIEPIRIRMHREPAYCIMTEEADGKPWFHDIKTYIQWKEYPIGASNNDRKTIQRLAMGFFLDGEILYKRNHDMTLLRQFKVKHHNSAPYRPQMNGAVGAANKNIKSILEKMTETYRDWHEKLPFALLAYQTTVRTSTGATPFSLVYGMEAVIPIEVEIPSLRVLKEAELTEAEWVQSRYDQLNLFEDN
ncbi:uncharacterized protein LOC131153776 [Malania oleifera]|uniref:uncharacterized protein LOC131153776 n=1 Tax=Malania oleifera TaxID=397392 RepID=UPI0025AE2E9F|nr:uncharacterized protein LOC131153776 [Malania oleifera]